MREQRPQRGPVRRKPLVIPHEVPTRNGCVLHVEATGHVRLGPVARARAGGVRMAVDEPVVGGYAWSRGIVAEVVVGQADRPVRCDVDRRSEGTYTRERD